MNVVDSSAWLSYFADDENAAVFAKPIERTDLLLVPSITIAEVFKNVLRQRGEETALIVTAHMKQGKIIPLDAETAMEAAQYGILHKLPLADSIIFATAQKFNATFWTQNSDFKGLPSVQYVARKSGR